MVSHCRKSRISTITAATMTVNIVSGTSTAYNASAYQVTGAEWASGTLQWSNMPDAETLLEENISHNEKTKYQFSCLAAVQHWYDGDTTGQNENYGVMIQYADETVADYNSFYSADCTDATMRPALTIGYQVQSSEINVVLGNSRQLPVPDSTETLTWMSSNSFVVSVNSSGVIIGNKAGQATVMVYAGDTELTRYSVNVIIASGVYYIKNVLAYEYLQTTGGVAENTGTTLAPKQTQGLPQLKQLWKVNHVGSGYYTIRPMYRLSMGLHTTSSIADIVTIGTNDSLTILKTSSLWKINGSAGRLTFYHTGSSALALKATESYNDYTISTAVHSASNDEFVWALESVSSITNQVLLLDARTGNSVEGKEIYIDPGEIRTLSELNWMTSVVCSYSLDQRITWYSYNESVRIDSATGTITGMTPGGEASISPRHSFSGTEIGPSYSANVRPVPDGVYYVRSRAYNRFLQIEGGNNDDSGARIVNWAYNGNDYQKWMFTSLDNGYYSIISVESGLAMTVSNGQSGESGASIVQKAYSGDSRQQWKITLSEAGFYKIKAKSSEGLSGDLVMSVGFGLQDDGDGVEIIQQEYSNDQVFKDEWLICTFADIGMSTDDYSTIQDRGRGSYTYANTFYNELPYPSEAGPFSLTHHYNKDSVHTASKNDFSENGAIGNEIDFMVYIGHGHYAKEPRSEERPWGNHIQYSYSSDGIVEYTDVCSNDQYEQEEVDKFCLYTSEVNFGSSTSDLRWVWMYTCNFLNSIEDYEEYGAVLPINGKGYVTDADLKEMMTGVHIVLGYTTASYLCSSNARIFAQYLRSGEPIIDAFFKAGTEGEAAGKDYGGTDDHHVQKVMYIPQARNETIYSPRIDYEYDASDVCIITQDIQEPYD